MPEALVSIQPVRVRDGDLVARAGDIVPPHEQRLRERQSAEQQRTTRRAGLHRHLVTANAEIAETARRQLGAADSSGALVTTSPYSNVVSSGTVVRPAGSARSTRTWSVSRRAGEVTPANSPTSTVAVAPPTSARGRSA